MSPESECTLLTTNLFVCAGSLVLPASRKCKMQPIEFHGLDTIWVKFWLQIYPPLLLLAPKGALYLTPPADHPYPIIGIGNPSSPINPMFSTTVLHPSETMII